MEILTHDKLTIVVKRTPVFLFARGGCSPDKIGLPPQNITQESSAFSP